MSDMPGQGKDSKLRIEEGEPFPMAWGMELRRLENDMEKCPDSCLCHLFAQLFEGLVVCLAK